MKTNFSHFLILFVILAMAGCMKMDENAPVQDEQATLKSATLDTEANMVPDEILVRFKAGTLATKKDALLEKLGGKLKEKVLTRMMEKDGDKEGFLVLKIKGTVAEAIDKVKGDPDLEYAEPNWIYKHCDETDDPYLMDGSLWGMYGATSSHVNPYGIHAAEVWTKNPAVTGSDNIYVGVIDEGIQYNHPDLADNIWENTAEKNGVSNVDDDGDGYIDDIYGWDFANNDNTIFDGAAGSDVDAHGTHVSGTIGALGNNGLGVVGVNWHVKIISAKFLGPNGGTTANAVKAVKYITMLKTVKGLNIVATNNSWGGGGYSTELYNAIKAAQSANILFIAAAGNSKSNNDRKASYPSNYNLNNVIAVAAITSTGALASWSSYGATTVDLGAPGVTIYSTLPVDGYGAYSGTSMATPHVTGACALYASTLNQRATADQLKAAIMSATTPTASLKGKCVTGGRLDVSKLPW